MSIWLESFYDMSILKWVRKKFYLNLVKLWDALKPNKAGLFKLELGHNQDYCSVKKSPHKSSWFSRESIWKFPILHSLIQLNTEICPSISELKRNSIQVLWNFKGVRKRTYFFAMSIFVGCRVYLNSQDLVTWVVWSLKNNYQDILKIKKRGIIQVILLNMNGFGLGLVLCTANNLYVRTLSTLAIFFFFINIMFFNIGLFQYKWYDI